MTTNIDPDTRTLPAHEERANGSLKLSGVRKTFGETEVLHSLDLEIPAGSFTTLLGPSGSGKTTLLRVIAGFETVSSGTVTLANRDITHLTPREREFGMVFQHYALFPHLTVEQNVAYPLRVRGVPAAERARRVTSYLQRVQMEPYAHRRPHELSGGQQQRVALARALIYEPRVLLLDEPMGALDKRLRIDIQAELRDLHRETGITFIHVTHDQSEAFALSTNVVIMRAGLIEQVGRPEDLYERPNSAFVADFINSANLLPCTVADISAGRATVALRDGTKLVVPSDNVHSGLSAGATATMVLHPEAGQPAADAEPTDGELLIPSSVLGCSYLGRKYEVTASSALGTLRFTSGSVLQRDSRTHARWSLADCRVVPPSA